MIPINRPANLIKTPNCPDARRIGMEITRCRRRYPAPIARPDTCTITVPDPKVPDASVSSLPILVTVAQVQNGKPGHVINFRIGQSFSSHFSNTRPRRRRRRSIHGCRWHTKRQEVRHDNPSSDKIYTGPRSSGHGSPKSSRRKNVSKTDRLQRLSSLLNDVVAGFTLSAQHDARHLSLRHRSDCSRCGCASLRRRKGHTVTGSGVFLIPSDIAAFALAHTMFQMGLNPCRRHKKQKAPAQAGLIKIATKRWFSLRNLIGRRVLRCTLACVAIYELMMA